MTGRYSKADREQAETHIRHEVEAFGGKAELWLKQLDELQDGIRIVTRDDDYVAGLSMFGDGQWYYGRRIPTWAIGGLTTAPPFRGEGAGKLLLTGMLREARAAGVPLSVLYASTPTFYRKCGFEPAGYVCGWECHTDDLPSFDHGALISRFEPDDADVRQCYADFARQQNGTLDRDERHWRFKLDPPDGKRYRYRFDFDDRIEGYVAISDDRSGPLHVDDYAATSVRARQAIVSFLYGHRSVNGKVSWYGGPQDALRKLIPENAARPTSRSDEWLLRITDVPAALMQRGYPKLHAELHLDVVDEVMPENAGRYVLTIRAGEPTVQPGGHGAIKLDIRGLTVLFTGFATAEQLADAGLVEADTDSLAVATMAFHGPAPFMTDQF
jgi:predicted acetyltransferase